METGKVIQLDRQEQINPTTEGLFLPADELKRLTDLFSILIKIDRKTKKEVVQNAS